MESSVLDKSLWPYVEEQKVNKSLGTAIWFIQQYFDYDVSHLLKLLGLPYVNNASKNVITTLLFEGFKANYSQLILNPDLMGNFSPIIVEELFRLVDIWNLTGYVLSLFLE